MYSTLILFFLYLFFIILYYLVNTKIFNNICSRQMPAYLVLDIIIHIRQLSQRLSLLCTYRQYKRIQKFRNRFVEIEILQFPKQQNTMHETAILTEKIENKNLYEIEFKKNNHAFWWLLFYNGDVDPDPPTFIIIIFINFLWQYF